MRTIGRLLLAVSMIVLFPRSSQSGYSTPPWVSYQGQYIQGGVPYTGTAYFKFALVDHSSNVTIWSNDDPPTSGEPTTSIALSVTSGLFSVYLGRNMRPLTPDLIGGCHWPPSPPCGSGVSYLELRVWVSTNASGPFQQLADQSLASGVFSLSSVYAARSEGNFRSDGDITRWWGNKALVFRQDADNSFISNKANFVGNGAASGGHLTLNGSTGVSLYYGDNGTNGTQGLTLNGAGNIGIGVTNTAVRLSVVGPNAVEIGGIARSPTFVASCGALGSAEGASLHLGNFGFTSQGTNPPDLNSISLGVKSVRARTTAFPGIDNWRSATVGLVMDVDNTPGAGGAGVWLHGNGNVGIGTVYPEATLHVNGTTSTSVLTITGGSDLSEGFEIGESQIASDDPIEPGMIVSIDPRNPGELVPSEVAYDTRVAGVISGAGGVQPGVIMGQEGSIADGKRPVALTGRVLCWADASYGPITAGDLLTSSPTRGHAMTVVDRSKAQGAIVGKALHSLKQGRGLILILVALQ